MRLSESRSAGNAFEKSAARRAGRKDPMVDIARRGTAGMAVTVDEAGLAEVTERLGVTPQEAVDVVLDCIKSRPWYAARAASRGSLGVALGTVLDNSEIAYAWDGAINSTSQMCFCVKNFRQATESF